MLYKIHEEERKRSKRSTIIRVRRKRVGKEDTRPAQQVLGFTAFRYGNVFENAKIEGLYLTPSQPSYLLTRRPPSPIAPSLLLHLRCVCGIAPNTGRRVRIRITPRPRHRRGKLLLVNHQLARFHSPFWCF